MICEFCGENIPKGEYSCPSCGSVIRNIFSDKSNTVISADKQSDISEYKSASRYKLSDEENTDDNTFYDVSKRHFSAQKASSVYQSNRDVIIGQNNTYAPPQKTYKMKEQDKPNYSQDTAGEGNGKVSLKKRERKKIQLKKEEQNTSKTFFNSNSRYTNEPIKNRFEGGYVELPDGMSKNDLMKSQFLSSVRLPFYLSIVLMYVSLLGMVVTGLVSISFYNIFSILACYALVLGIQIKNSFICACTLAAYSFSYIFVMLFVYDTWGGYTLFIAAILSVFCMKKFNSIWNEYLDTGKIPYNIKK